MFIDIRFLLTVSAFVFFGLECVASEQCSLFKTQPENYENGLLTKTSRVPLSQSDPRHNRPVQVVKNKQEFVRFVTQYNLACEDFEKSQSSLSVTQQKAEHEELSAQWHTIQNTALKLKISHKKINQNGTERTAYHIQ